MSQDWYADVLEFHKKFGCAIGSTPAAPYSRTAALRARLIREEIDETVAAIKAGDLAGVADGIADSIYVLLGTAIAYGIDVRPVFDAVHRANLSKSQEKRGDGKVLKGPSFTPPDVAGVLARQGPIIDNPPAGD